MWIWTKPTSFLDHVFLGCTQRECKPNEIIINQKKRNCSNHELLPPQLNYYQDGRNLTQNTVAWSCDMEGHAKKCVESCCELANKKTEQLYTVSKPGLDNHNFKKEELETVGELSDVCSQIVLKCFYLARIGRLDIFWVRKQACSRSHLLNTSL